MINSEGFFEKCNEILSAILSKRNLVGNLYIIKVSKSWKKYYNKKINAKEGSQCICISVILIDSVYRKDKSYYPQVFLEKCKYDAREKTI